MPNGIDTIDTYSSVWWLNADWRHHIGQCWSIHVRMGHDGWIICQTHQTALIIFPIWRKFKDTWCSKVHFEIVITEIEEKRKEERKKNLWEMVLNKISDTQSNSFMFLNVYFSSLYFGAQWNWLIIQKLCENIVNVMKLNISRKWTNQNEA